MSYIHKPLTVEAFQWNGGPRENWPSWAKRRLDPVEGNRRLLVNTLEFTFVNRGDWVTRDQWGRIHVVAPDLFNQCFDKVPNEHEDEPELQLHG